MSEFQLIVESFTGNPVNLKDFSLGFFMALALKRRRVRGLLDRALPGDEAESDA